MKKICAKLIVMLAVLLLLVLPQRAQAASNETLADYVDLANLERYIDGKFDQADLSDFNIPESMLEELKAFVATKVPETALQNQCIFYCSDGIVMGYICTLDDTMGMESVAYVAAELLYGIEGNDHLTDVEKALLIHDRLTRWLRYGEEYGWDYYSPYTAYGALIVRTCVCEGYARTYSYLMNRVGVPCQVHSSEAMNHAWNAVRIDGKWYMVDVTWDDTGAIGEDILHDYFLTSERSGMADEDVEPYDTAYDNVRWGDFHFLLGGEVYAVKDNYLYRLKGTQLEKVTFPVDGMRYGVTMQLPCLDVGDELFYNGADHCAYALNIKTGERRLITVGNLHMMYNSGRVASIAEGESWHYIFGNWWYPLFESRDKYTVEFRDWDGRVLQTGKYVYADLVRPPEDPVRPADANGGYVFTGWSEPVTLCSGDKVYTATYTRRCPNGWQKINGTWFYYIDSGVKTGWLQQGKDWYYLKDTGGMHTDLAGIYNGYTYDYYRFAPDGRMVTGWYKEADTWYYFASSGKRVEKAWLLSGGKYYYLGDNGVMQTGFITDGTGRYYLDQSGAMRTGMIQTADGQVCFADAYGRLRTGWIKHNGKYYYTDRGNGIAVKGMQQIDGVSYYFDDKGIMQTGWVKQDRDWYYFDANGAMVKSWQKIGNDWYCFDRNGKMITGSVASGGKYYYMKPSGAMVVGWYMVDGVWRYYDQSGARVIGWVKVGNTYYYTEHHNKGYFTGHHCIDKKYYWFDENGRMLTGWIQETKYYPLQGGKTQVVTYWYYAEPDGALVSDAWKKLGNTWYYFAYGGIMQTGRVYIDGTIYTFSESGAWIP